MARRTPPTCADKALRLLAMRPHSELELRRKLARNFPLEEVERVVDDCRKKGFLNDELLAQDSVQFLSDRGCGSRLIRQKLRARGIAPDLVRNAVEDNAENEEPAARTALEFKLRMLNRETDRRKKKEKAFRFMVSRGFAPGLTLKLLSEMLNSDNSTDDGEFFDD